MKSYNHLYEQIITKENRLEAVRLAKHSPRIRKALTTEEDEDVAEDALGWIENFHNSPHTPVHIYDGMSHKERTIIVPTTQELIVQHALINVLKPVFMRGMYEHSYASLPYKGAHRGKKAIEKWLKNDSRNCKYCLKMDIRHFFDSIPHDIIIRRFTETIHDEKVLKIILEIINVNDTGLPLGYYTSQWFSNWYLTPLDHYIKQELHAVHYIRYMDDMVIFGPDKESLHRIREQIGDYLQSELGLTLKSNWQVFPLEHRCLDFMGFRFFRDRVILRRSIMLKASRKARRIAKKVKPTLYELRQMLSYLGWIDATNTYGYYLKYIKPFVSFQYCKRRISNAARRERNHGMETRGITAEAGSGRYDLLSRARLCA